MASANSLLGLVSQLQSMEATFTSIFLESILKLSSLTDAKVFVLVESQEGRRVAGADHLCQAFAEGSLGPDPADLEVFLEQPNVYALGERPLVGARRPAAFSSPRINGSISSANRKRTFSPLNRSDHPPRPIKERRSAPVEAFKKEPDIQAFNTSDLDAFDGEVVDQGVEDENQQNGDHEVSTEDFGHIEDDTFAEIIFSKSSKDDGDSTSSIPKSFFSPTVGDVHSVVPHGSGLHSFSSSDLAFIDDFLATNHKVQPVQAIRDNSVTEKSSVENKVTLSLIYDFAKCLFANCPFQHFKDDGFKEFFETSFEKFWDHFPNFSLWEEMNMRFQERVDKRTNMCRMAAPKSFLRQKIRINVINLMLSRLRPGPRVRKSLPY